MSKVSGFRSTIVSLWFQLITISILSLVFCEGLFILRRTQIENWLYYLTPPEVAFELVVRFVAAALAGVALGTVCTAVIAPFLWFFQSSRDRLADWSMKVAVVLAVFVVSRYSLAILLRWSYNLFDHRAIFDSLLPVVYSLAFAVALFIPRARKEVVTSLDGFLSEKMTRRTAIATVVGTAALVTSEFVLARTAPSVKAALAPQRPKSNFLLITFDALNAEDMSLYGRKLPTTPYIDSLASKSTVFTNVYSASTFTTPSLAAILTGLYPSESHVHQLKVPLHVGIADKSLPHLMRAAGYGTGAFLSSPYAFYLGKNLESAFDVLPEPAFHNGAVQQIWEATRPLHQDSRIGCRLDEYYDLTGRWNTMGWMPDNLSVRYRPTATFEHARQVLAQLPDGFFLWVHVVTPHNPYLPDPMDVGRFLPDKDLRSYEWESDTRWQPHYEPSQQHLVDPRRLRYDEFIVTADRAFGAFMKDLETSGKLQDTTVIVSADHGESFEGGIYQHRSPYLTRPVIHVPLIIQKPNQQEGRKIAVTADQTSLAPTILELAGQPKPDWMRGQSLAGWLGGNSQGEGEGLAFCQYLEKNSVFKPLRHGTIGVIDGQFQYVFDLDTQKGTLRPLNEAHIWNLDRAAENPARAAALQAAIYSRFPELRIKTT